LENELVALQKRMISEVEYELEGELVQETVLLNDSVNTDFS